MEWGTEAKIRFNLGDLKWAEEGRWGGGGARRGGQEEMRREKRRREERIDRMRDGTREERIALQY